MIKDSEVFKIGKLTKTHGVKGEIAFRFDNDIFDRVNCPYLILKIDEILVPFFFEEYRFKGEDTALFKFTDLDSEDKVAKLQGLEVYFPRKYYEDTQDEDLSFSWDYFIGFKVNDAESGELGTIVSVDTQTINTLFLIEDAEGDETIIPAVEEFIINIDQENKIINLKLPEGLIE